jgi:hypothetical protein
VIKGRRVRVRRARVRLGRVQERRNLDLGNKVVSNTYKRVYL